MIEQFQQPKEEYTTEELKKILEQVSDDLDSNSKELAEALLEEKEKEGLSDAETLERAMLLAKKVILTEIKQALNASQFE